MQKADNIQVSPPTARQTGRDISPSGKTPRFWLSEVELKQVIGILKHTETRVLAMLVSSLGFKYSDFTDLKWSCLNAVTGDLFIKGAYRALPKQALTELLALREQATAEDALIFKTLYKNAWHRVSGAFYKADICQAKGVFRLLKWSYCRLHFLKYRSKKRLAKAIGIRSTRYLPRAIFEIKALASQPCLIEF